MSEPKPGLEGLVEALRLLGVPMRTTRQFDPKPVEVTPDVMDLLYDDERNKLLIYMQRTTYRAPALDAPGEYNELRLERLIVELYT